MYFEIVSGEYGNQSTLLRLLFSSLILLRSEILVIFQDILPTRLLTYYRLRAVSYFSFQSRSIESRTGWGRVGGELNF